MLDANEIPVDAVRRRRRRVALVLTLASALLASGFIADTLFHDKEGDETAWTIDTVFPKPIHRTFKPHGVTIPLGKRRAVHNGQGGPEDPGPYIAEARDGWFLEDGQKPIDGLARTGFTLPGGGASPGGARYLPGGGFGGGGGSGGGGSSESSITLACPKDAAALEALTGKKTCADAGSSTALDEPSAAPGDGSLPFTTVVTTTVGGAQLPAGDGFVGGDNPNSPAGNPVSIVPEPQNWAMMIAGFFMTGLAIRSRRRKMRRKVAITR